MKTTHKILILFSAVALPCLLAIQFVPVDTTNPPMRGAPRWDSPRTEALARRACYDCHSNETHWPAYARIAPVSWWLAAHVHDGRRHLNFSEPPFDDADEAAEATRDGDMPLWSYRLGHPEARLTQTETAELITGLTRTFGADDDD